MSTTSTRNGIPSERHISNDISITSSFLTDSPPENVINDSDGDEDPRNFTIRIYKEFKIHIYKPLIFLKIAFFVWYGAGSALGPFITVFLKQKGLTLTEFSAIFAIMPAIKLISTVVSGIIVDKLGSSKPVLVVNILLSVVCSIGMLVTPSMNLVNCISQPVSVICHQEKFGQLITTTSCDTNTDAIELVYCNVICPENVTQHCNGQDLLCQMFTGKEKFDNFSLTVHVGHEYKLKSKYYHKVTSMSHKNVTYSWCNIPHKMYCNITCLITSEESYSDGNSVRTVFAIIHAVLLILLSTVYTNCYRIMDMTAMSLVKRHNSDYGKQRFFALSGMLIFSPVAGYLIDVTTPNEGARNYDIAFYIFIGMVFLLFPIIYKLDVHINPPSKNMWRKSFYLAKNPDIISFLLVLIILGTTWGFTHIYLYLFLEEINSPTVLLGLLQSSSALYALPILVASNWFVEKIGTNRIFTLGFLGYVVRSISYSLLYDPWLSLLIEVTGIFTYHLLWVAVVVYSHNVAPEGLTGTVIALAGGVHFTLGRGFGGSGGGLIIEAFGVRMAFIVMAAICLSAAVFYEIYLYIRNTCCAVKHTMDKRHDGKKEEQNEVDSMPDRHNLKRYSV